ncbi:MAG: tetratricopeptide (TPR) repeat protein [Mariniblastus sp.]|jgi:tetratricopeptide (TPR) repeat protein
MSEFEVRFPKLDLFYQQYLTDENSATFIYGVSRSYCLGTLQRLAKNGGRLTRRAAILAIGFLGDYSSNEIMGASLVDSDRAVRLLADHGIREIWQRQGNSAQRQSVQQLYRLISQSRMEEAIDAATCLINFNPKLGEAWNQRAIASCADGEFTAAIADCRETLNCNRFHFPAAIGMAHCFLQLDDPVSALEGFRLALRINPDLEGVRSHIAHLEKTRDEG